MNAETPGAQESATGPRDPNLTVAELMRTDFRSCNVGTNAREVAQALRDSQCPILAVTRAQVPIGVVTERTLASAIAEYGPALEDRTARDLMTEASMTIPMDAKITTALDRIQEIGSPLLAVDSDGVLKGVVTLSQLAAQLSDAALGRIALRVDRCFDATRPVARMTTPGTNRGADPPAGITPSTTRGQDLRWDSPTHAHPEPVPLVSQADLVNPMLRVSDAMTAAPRTCSPASSVLEAVMIFRDAKCGAVPVVDDGRAVGMLTDRDVALALGEHEAELSRLPAESVMTAGVVTIKADAALESAIECIGEQGIRRLLVVDSDEKLVGILSWTDLVPHLSERGLGHTVARMIGHR